MFSEEAVKAITYLLGELRIMSAAKMTDWQCDYIIFFVNQIELGHNRASIRRKAKNILEQIKTDWTEEEKKSSATNGLRSTLCSVKNQQLMFVTDTDQFLAKLKKVKTTILKKQHKTLLQL